MRDGKPAPENSLAEMSVDIGDYSAKIGTLQEPVAVDIGVYSAKIGTLQETIKLVKTEEEVMSAFDTLKPLVIDLLIQGKVTKDKTNLKNFLRIVTQALKEYNKANDKDKQIPSIAGVSVAVDVALDAVEKKDSDRLEVGLLSIRQSFRSMLARLQNLQTKRGSDLSNHIQEVEFKMTRIQRRNMPQDFEEIRTLVNECSNVFAAAAAATAAAATANTPNITPPSAQPGGGHG